MNLDTVNHRTDANFHWFGDLLYDTGHAD